MSVKMLVFSLKWFPLISRQSTFKVFENGGEGEKKMQQKFILGFFFLQY